MHQPIWAAGIEKVRNGAGDGDCREAQFFGQVIVDVQADPVTRTAVAVGDVTIPAVDVEGVADASGDNSEGDDNNPEGGSEDENVTDDETSEVIGRTSHRAGNASSEHHEGRLNFYPKIASI